MERRGGKIEDNGEGLILRHKTFNPVGFPYITTYSDSAPYARKVGYEGPRAGCKISGLIENSVVRQSVLAVDGDYFAFLDYRRAVVTVLDVWFGEADDNGCLVDAFRKVFGSRHIVFEEIFFMQQVLWRIAAHAQFGKQYNLGSFITCPVVETFYLRCVLFEVADGGIYLGQCYPHRKAFRIKF
jgi:hypothetical protein